MSDPIPLPNLASAWRTEVPRAARHALSALPWVWRSNRPAVAGMMAITLISGLLPAAQAFVGKLIVDAVVAAVGHAGIGGSGWEAFRSAVQPVALYLGLEFALHPRRGDLRPGAQRAALRRRSESPARAEPEDHAQVAPARPQLLRGLRVLRQAAAGGPPVGLAHDGGGRRRVLHRADPDQPRFAAGPARHLQPVDRAADLRVGRAFAADAIAPEPAALRPGKRAHRRRAPARVL